MYIYYKFKRINNHKFLEYSTSFVTFYLYFLNRRNISIRLSSFYFFFKLYFFLNYNLEKNN